MGRMLKLELSRALHSRLLPAALIVGLLIAVSHYLFVVLEYRGYMEAADLWTADAHPFSVFGSWLGGDPFHMQSSLYFILLPALASLPYADSFFLDRKSGYIKQIVTRTKKSRYLAAKYIAVFIVAGLTVVLPLLVNLGLTAATLPSLLPQITWGNFTIGANHLWAETFYTQPYLYVAGYLGLIFLFSGLFAAIALAVSFVSENRFIVMLSPFLTGLFVLSLLSLLGESRYSPLDFLNPASAHDTGLLAILAEALTLLLVTGGVFFLKGNCDDVL